MRAVAGRIGRFVAIEHGGLTAVLVLSLAVRLWLLRWWSPFPFGDVFNFVRIAQGLAEWNYPIHEKRLPFYPFLIFVAHTLFPWLHWETIAIGLALVLSVVALALLYAIARTVRLSKVAALVTVLLTAAFPPFLSYSIRGYADTTLLVLVLAAILVGLQSATWRGGALLGFLLGAASLTRYEGAFAAMVLIGLHAVRARARVRRLVPVVVALVLTLLPYVLLARSVGRSLLPAAYIAEASASGSGYGVSSAREVGERFVLLWQRLGLFEAWRTPLGLLRSAREDFLGLHRPLVDLFVEPRSAAALLAIPGFLFLVWRRRLLDVCTVLLPFFAMAVPIAWYALYVRYEAFLFPLLALAAGAGVHAGFLVFHRATEGPHGRALRASVGAALLLFASFVWFLGFTQETQESLRKSRFRELGYYRALQYVETLPGIVAFAERRGITEAYFGTRAVYAPELFARSAGDDAHWKALRASSVVVVLAQPAKRPTAFGFITHPPADVRVEEVARFVVEQGNHDLDEAIVYRLHF
ncbi:MAG: glycosyltransferase family 39 protein [bacterium]|nr:glycosyltransferase family 39 protein [bacterium]